MRLTTALVADARRAGRGLAGLLRGRPGWEAGFAFSTDGFLRSFAAPLLGLPLYVAATALVVRSGAKLEDGGSLFSAGLSQLIDGLGFPLVLALAAGPLRLKDGYAAFVIASNWASLYLNLLLLAASLLALAGADGMALFGWASLLILSASIFVTWRIAHETLTRELAPLVLVVLGAVGWGVLADEVARKLLG